MSEKDSLTPVRGRRLYKYAHRHKHGDDTGIFWASPDYMDDIEDVDLAVLLGIDVDGKAGTMFDPEELTWEIVPLESIQDITPQPAAGPGNPLEFLSHIDWDLLRRQREELAEAGFMDEDLKDGLMEFLSGIQDLGTDTFT